MLLLIILENAVFEEPVFASGFPAVCVSSILCPRRNTLLPPLPRLPVGKLAGRRDPIRLPGGKYSFCIFTRKLNIFLSPPL